MSGIPFEFRFLDFSGITLDNWAAKVANMLIEELDLTEDSLISIDLPPGWQAVAIALGALAAGIPVTFFDAAISDVVFVAENAHKDATEKAVESDAADPSEYSGDVVIVTNDPFWPWRRRNWWHIIARRHRLWPDRAVLW